VCCRVQLSVLDDTQNQWTLSRALLSVMLAAELVRPEVCVFSACSLCVSVHDRRSWCTSYACVSSQSFEQFKMSMIHTQPPDVQPKLGEAFDKLMKEVSRYVCVCVCQLCCHVAWTRVTVSLLSWCRSLDSCNRDRFSQRLSIFRMDVRQFLKF
jgi:hypothetical protein